MAKHVGWYVVEPLSLPSFPPINAWDAYILFLLVPMLMRIILLSRPFIRVTKQLAPHGGWFFKRLKELPIRGMGLLAFNEILAFFLPMLLVLVLRMASDPLGWQTWDETPILGLVLIIVAGLLWIGLDILRIARIRRMLSAIEKQNIERLRKAADAGLGARGWLRRFARKDKPEEEDEGTVSRVAKGALATWGLRALKARKFTPAGLVSAVATGAAIEVARMGADKVSDMIDERMQEEFEKIAETNSTTLLFLFMRDLAMGIIPIVILWSTPLITG
jgi:hypothetical protein